MDRPSETIIERHLAYRQARRPGSEALWRMSAEERQAAMWRGELTWEQLWEWAAKAPGEVPLINDEFAFIAAYTPEVAELAERATRTE